MAINNILQSIWPLPLYTGSSLLLTFPLMAAGPSDSTLHTAAGSFEWAPPIIENPKEPKLLSSLTVLLRVISLIIGCMVAILK